MNINKIEKEDADELIRNLKDLLYTHHLSNSLIKDTTLFFQLPFTIQGPLLYFLFEQNAMGRYKGLQLEHSTSILYYNDIRIEFYHSIKNTIRLVLISKEKEI